MPEIAIKINNLKKQYILGAIGGRTLSAELNVWWAKLRGKEDPYAKIGEDTSNYGQRFYALDGINLEIRKGEAVGIIGINGAGKSTLLKILSRVTAPTEGSVCINGKVTSMLEVGTGFHPELTGRENIYMNGAILGMTKAEIDSKMEAIIDFSECRQFIDTPVKRYSSGMYVKLAFSVAAHLDSDIMIMDEVLAVGDAKFQEKCLGKMDDEANNAGKTVLYVSHNMNTIRKLCKRCIVLSHGTVVFDGDVEQAIEIYMDQNISEDRVLYNLIDFKRDTIGQGTLVQLQEFEFLGKNKPVFYNDERVKLRIKWKSFLDVKSLRLRIRLHNADSTPVGLAESEIIGDGIAGEIGVYNLEWDISNIVAGRYYFAIVLYVLNDYGTADVYDHPVVNIGMTVEDHVGGKEKVVSWDKKWWNSVRLNTIHKM